MSKSRRPPSRLGPVPRPPNPQIGSVTMKKTSILAAVAAASLTLAACGGDDSGGDSSGKEMRLALNQTEDHPSYIALESFGTALAEDTEDRWSIDVYPNETLGAQAEALQLVSNGTVDMAIVSGTQLENLNEDFLVLNMPGAFQTIEGQMDIVNDQDALADLYTSLEDSESITVLGGFTQGNRHVYTSDGPVETPEDLAGQKIRVQESDLHLSMISAMGGSATPMAYGEVYTAMQSGVLDGAENNEVSYFTQKHFEVAPYFSQTNHLVGLDYLIINSNTLESMSDEDRAAFDEGWTASYTEHTELWAEATEEAIAGAEAGGAEFSEVDEEAFAEALSTLQDEFLTTDSQQELWDLIHEGN